MFTKSRSDIGLPQMLSIDNYRYDQCYWIDVPDIYISFGKRDLRGDLSLKYTASMGIYHISNGEHHL